MERKEVNCDTTMILSPEVNDETELEDMGSVGWDVLKRMETDEDRKSWVQVCPA